ncbi:MAG: IS6120 family transposase, partial [uncultured Arthrobacter sp.]
ARGGVAGRGRRLHRPVPRPARRQRAAAGRAQRQPPAPRGADLGRGGRGDRAAGQRPPHRPRYRRTSPVLLGDPAALVPQDPEDHRSPAAALPARTVLGRLRARAGPVPRLHDGAVRAGDHEADRGVEGRAAGVLPAGPVRGRLRLPVGRRDPRQHPARGAQAVPAGVDRCPGRRAQGARRAGRWLPRVDRVLGRPAPRLRAAGHARPGPRGRRWCARVLGCPARGLPRHAGATLLVPQDRQRARCPAEVRPPGREEGPGRDLERRGPPPRPRCREVLRGRLRGEVPQGRHEDHRRCRGAVGGLRLPRRALDPPAHHEPDRVNLRHRPAPHEDHPRTRLPSGRARDGVQAHRGRPGPLAGGERPAPGRARPRRRAVHQRQARGTTRRPPPTRSRL